MERLAYLRSADAFGMILAMRFHFVAAVVLISAVSMVCADEAPKPAGPKNPAAQTAIAKHEKTLADAAQVYQLAKIKADQELVATLKKIQADVMKGGGPAALAESNAIQAKIDDLQREKSLQTDKELTERLADHGDVIWIFGNQRVGGVRFLRDGTILPNSMRAQRWEVQAGNIIVTDKNGVKMIMSPETDGFHGSWPDDAKSKITLRTQ